MALLQEENAGKRFLTFAEGKLREKVAKGDADETTVKAEHPNAVLRSGTTPSGEPYAKWELTYPGIRAFITSIDLQKGNYRKQVLINLKDENDEEFILALGATSRIGTGFMQMIPNLNLAKEITIKAYSDFKTKEGKEIIGGLSFTQDGQKIASAFYNPKTKEQLLGMPKPEIDKRTKKVDYDTYWPIRDKWLQDYLLDNNYMSYVDATAQQTEVEATPTPDGDDF
jgi:hypothetical protein